MIVLMSFAGTAPAQQMSASNPTCFYRSIPYVSRLSYEVREAGGKRILLAVGGFDADATRRLEQFLNSAGPIDEIWFDSPGGVAKQGVEMGLLLRKRGIATRVPTGFSCISACTFAFLGGPFRAVSPYANYGVHAFYKPDSLGSLNDVIGKAKRDGVPVGDAVTAFMHENEVSTQQLAADLTIYAQRMGISREFMAKFVFAQKSIAFATVERQKAAEGRGAQTATVRCMTINEMQSLKVINQ